MSIIQAAPALRALRTISPLHLNSRAGSDDGFEIVDEGYGSDTFSYPSRPESRLSMQQVPPAVPTPRQTLVPPALYLTQAARMPRAESLFVPAFAPVPQALAEAPLSLEQQRRLMRQHDLASYERLLLPVVRLGAWHDASQLRCPLTQQPLNAIARPVLVRRHQTFYIYDEAAFLQWWLEHGTEPVTGRRTSLMALFRPQT